MLQRWLAQDACAEPFNNIGSVVGLASVPSVQGKQQPFPKVFALHHPRQMSDP